MASARPAWMEKPRPLTTVARGAALILVVLMVVLRAIPVVPIERPAKKKAGGTSCNRLRSFNFA